MAELRAAQSKNLAIGSYPSKCLWISVCERAEYLLNSMGEAPLRRLRICSYCCAERALSPKERAYYVATAGEYLLLAESEMMANAVSNGSAVSDSQPELIS